MKKIVFLLFAVALYSGPAHAQPGPGPKFDTAMAKLYGGNQSFSASIETYANMNGEPTVMPGKISVLDGKSRFEMNMADMTGGAVPPQAVTQMKSMGMDKVIAITRPDQQVAYLVYPGMNAYAVNQINDPSATNAAASFKIETKPLGTETVDGHPCTKEDAVVTDAQGGRHEFTVWDATDLKNFPVKIQMSQGGQTVTIVYSNVKLAKPDAALFDPPSGYTRYDSMQDMMQAEMMKRMGSGGSPPPGQ